MALRSMPEYGVWDNMIGRCFRSRDSSYKNYGGRGITVCTRWRDFRNFLADMGERPNPDLTLERINNDGNYEPGNCRWATYKEQHRNRRGNRWIDFNGERLVLEDWADRLGIVPSALVKRLGRYPLSVAMTTASRHIKRHVVKGDGRPHSRTLTVHGQSHSISEWEKITGIKYSTILVRLKRGWDPESALNPIQLNNGLNFTKNRKLATKERA